ncbi:MAG: SPOR domain-containing protein [Bacteroidales bacterium]|nr:SPOR domain-containing protein [Bacteroidales bacterium]
MQKAKRWFLLWVLCYLTILTFGQQEAALEAVFDAGDIKKLTKAEEYKGNADKLIEEAARLNMEELTVGSDATLNEKSRQRKVEQLQNQALQKYLEAASWLEKCNEIKFTVYRDYLNRFWDEHDGEEEAYLNEKLMEEQASDHFFQALNYRLEAKKMDADYARVERLNEANALEEQALRKQVDALLVYHKLTSGTTVTETSGEEMPELAPVEEQVPSYEEQAVTDYAAYQADTSVTVTGTESSPVNYDQQQTTEPAYVPEISSQQVPQEHKTIPENVTLDQEVIDAYNRYMASGMVTDTTLSTGHIAGLTGFETDRVLQLWYEYRYGQPYPGEAPALTDTVKSAEPATEVAVTDQPDAVEMTGGEPVMSDEAEDEPVMQEEAADEPVIGIVTDENRGQLVPADENVIYRVQIAANRTELTQRALSKIYYGSKNVEMISEGGWYKYSVGDFDSYEEASRFRKESGVSNAFVVAYRKGTRLVAAGAEEVTETPAAVVPAGEARLPEGIIFRVQVAASRVPLSMAQFRRIYGGNLPVEMISEEGWYKYQLMGTRLFSDTRQLLQLVNVRGAFVVAYSGGSKVNLAEAVRNTKPVEDNVRKFGRRGYVNEIEFHVQLAASRSVMPRHELQLLYNGAEPVSVIYEDGWYKYHLKAGNSPELALQLRQSCGISNAFIVAYKRGHKLTYYQAIQELK